MAMDKFDDELAAMFEAEDASLRADADIFERRIDLAIGRKLLMRRLVLAGATMIGGLVAGAQLPDILLQINSYGGFGLSVFDDAAEHIKGQSLMMVMIGVAALGSMVTLLSAERI